MGYSRNPTKRPVVVYPRPGGGVDNTGYNGRRNGFDKMVRRWNKNVTLATNTRAWNMYGNVWKITHYHTRWRVPGRYVDGRHHPLAPHSRRRFLLLTDLQWRVVLLFYGIECVGFDRGQLRAAWASWCGIRVPATFINVD